MLYTTPHAGESSTLAISTAQDLTRVWDLSRLMLHKCSHLFRQILISHEILISR